MQHYGNRYDGRESTNSSGQMLAWVQSLPVGTVVAGGIIDEVRGR